MQIHMYYNCINAYNHTYLPDSRFLCADMVVLHLRAIFIV